jgi:hypothetical protein
MIELDERPILSRLLEDLRRAETAPLGNQLTKLSRYLTEVAGPNGRLFPDEHPETPQAVLAQVALLSHTLLNSTFCVLQPRLEQAQNR